MFLVDIKIYLKPVFHAESPYIILKVDDTELYNGQLNHDQTFEYKQSVTQATHNITLEFLNKKDSDCIGDLDKAVIIDKVTFFNIESNNVLLNSTYKPLYSTSYLKTLINENKPIKHELKGCNYMGWNGTWTLSFNIPVFSWLHKIDNLGWLTTYN